MSAEARLNELGIELPKLPPPAHAYVRCVQVGDLVFLSGHVAVGFKGKLGADLTVEQGAEAARTAALGLLASLRGHLGTLDRVIRFVKVLGMVNAAPDFERHGDVMNGASRLFLQVFGAAGEHARSSVGMGSLPGGAPVEIEMVVQVL